MKSLFDYEQNKRYIAPEGKSAAQTLNFQKDDNDSAQQSNDPGTFKSGNPFKNGGASSSNLFQAGKSLFTSNNLHNN